MCMCACKGVCGAKRTTNTLTCTLYTNPIIPCITPKGNKYPLTPHQPPQRSIFLCLICKPQHRQSQLPQPGTPKLCLLLVQPQLARTALEFLDLLLQPLQPAALPVQAVACSDMMSRLHSLRRAWTGSCSCSSLSSQRFVSTDRCDTSGPCCASHAVRDAALPSSKLSA